MKVHKAGKFENSNQGRFRLILIDRLSDLEKRFELQFFSLVFVGLVNQRLEGVMGHETLFCGKVVQVFSFGENVHYIKSLGIRGG